MEINDYIARAKSVLATRKAEVPGSPMHADIEAQLNYVQAVVDGDESDKSRLHKLTLGVYAGKEYDVSDPEFARALSDVYYIACQIADGLKVKLP
ncbi:immunity protein Tsi6 family protein [Salinicola sp. CPA57]|uniref:immunity protein Tsi6 family protein n=1 Tax=Salinicola sp. CPA57 TaxID=1949080 RepID=UPI000DA11897|nr:immunity protein Tsi6 family protein [Salinicola sp. CPA57]